MPVGIVIIITTVIAGGLGMLIGWWLGRSRSPTAPSDLRLENEWRRQLAQREAEVVMKRDQLTHTMTSLAHALATRGTAERKVIDMQKVTPFKRTRNTGGEIDSSPPGELKATTKRLPVVEDQTVAPTQTTTAINFAKPLFTELK